MGKSKDLRRYINLYEEIPTVCLMLDKDLIIKEINNFGLNYLGYQRDELVNESISKICPNEDRAYLLKKLNHCLKSYEEIHSWECSRVRKDGSRYWVRDNVRTIKDEYGEDLLLVSSEDITETRYLISELERQNSIDMLTGLTNRRKFDRYLEELMLSSNVRGDNHFLLYIDLDKFKVVNDSCGHLCGDEMLRQIAVLLRKQVKAENILARIGGDEFGLILENCSEQEAIQVGEGILKEMERFSFSWNDMTFSVGVSIGGVIIDGSENNLKNLLHYADTACFTAKDKGQYRIQIYNMDDKEMERRGGLQKWVSRIHQSIENDKFVLFKQKIYPVIDNHNEPEKYEILIRMKDDDGTLILPGSFIPAAEYYGVSPKIDRWVTETALKRYAATSHERPVTYFINLSGLTLSDDSYMHDISEEIRAMNDDGLQICFEITETAAIRNLTAAQKFMSHFKRLGCQFALDDFGSGFSSFGYLRTLPVDYIKIDGGFVRNMVKEPLDLAVVRAIHEVSEVFGKRTIAEFVETEEILNMIKGLGIDYAQGYHIEKPHPLSEADQ